MDNFKLNIMQSNRYYREKPEGKTSAMIKTRDLYTRQSLTPMELYGYFRLGYHFHPLCGASDSRSSSGRGIMTFKKELLEENWLVVIDLDYKGVSRNGWGPDEMPEWSDDILTLEYDGQDVSPTFWYRSYSYGNKSKDKGNNIHAVYVFNRPIPPHDFTDVALTTVYRFKKGLEAKGVNIPKLVTVKNRNGDEKSDCVIDQVTLDPFQGIWGGQDAGGYLGRIYDPSKTLTLKGLSLKERERAALEAEDYVWGAPVNRLRKIAAAPKNRTGLVRKTREASARYAAGLTPSNLGSFSTEGLDLSKCRLKTHPDRWSWNEVWPIICYLKYAYGEYEDTAAPESACRRICRALLVPLYYEKEWPEDPLGCFDRDYGRLAAFEDAVERKYSVMELIGETGAFPMFDGTPDARTICDRYLSERFDWIIGQTKKVTLLESRPGTGKTTFTQMLKGKVLVIQMLTSIVDSCKYETADDGHVWRKAFGNCHIDRFSDHEKVVAVVDKLQTQSLDDLKDFDWIVVDESHILTDSAEYRTAAMGYAVDMLRNLASSADFKGKIILMTGTPVGERKLFPALWHVKVDDNSGFSRKVRCILTNDTEYSLERTIEKLLSEGKRVLFPTNRSDARDTLTGTLAKRSDFGLLKKSGVFSRGNRHSKLVENIKNLKRVPDSVRLLCCTNYMSVGLDILDEDEWTVVFRDEFTAAQMIQFANRLREKDLEIYWITRAPKAPAFSRKDCEAAIETSRKLVNQSGVSGLDKIRDSITSAYPVFRTCLTATPGLHGVSYEVGCFVVDQTMKDLWLEWQEYKFRHLRYEAVLDDFEASGWDVGCTEENVSSEESLDSRSGRATVRGEHKALLSEEALKWLDHKADVSCTGQEYEIEESVKSLFDRKFRNELYRLFGITHDWKAVRDVVRALSEDGPLKGNEIARILDLHDLLAKKQLLSAEMKSFTEDVRDFVYANPVCDRTALTEFLNAESDCWCGTRDGGEVDPRIKDIVTGGLRTLFDVMVKRENKRITKVRQFSLTLRSDALGDWWKRLGDAPVF